MNRRTARLRGEPGWSVCQLGEAWYRLRSVSLTPVVAVFRAAAVHPPALECILKGCGTGVPPVFALAGRPCHRGFSRHS